jgi:hypothetical protein
MCHQLILCLGWNLSTMNIPNPANDLWALGPLLGIDQHWGMFSPRPPDTDFWYTIEGNTTGGQHIEIWHDGGLFEWKPRPVEWEMPQPLHKSIGNHRWFKYYEMYNQANTEALRLAYGRYICREWNKRYEGNDQLHMFNVWVLQERHNLDGTSTPLNKILLWGHRCY